MPCATIEGIQINYELLGNEGDPAVALTPGGRFSLETPGLRELALKLAAGGKRVLIWDRPNCGLSDICFDIERSESSLHADVLAKLLVELQLGPTALAGGSAGSRVSLLVASRHRDLISHLVLWWISGGPIGIMQLAMIYCGNAAHAAILGGMEAAALTGDWPEMLARNPRAKAAFLKMNPADFIEVMQRWASAYVPSSATPVPGLSAEDFGRLNLPVLVFRSGEKDLSHPRETSEQVHRLIPQSQLDDPPWSADEWNERVAAWQEGRAEGLFVNWPMLASRILKFAN